MLPLQYRLKRQADFTRVIQGGRKLRGAYLLGFFLPSSQEYSRLGVIVSKKVSKKAVVRNRLRRVITHLARPLLINWGDKPTGDLVVMVIAAPPGDTSATIEREVHQWLKQL